MSTNTNTDTKTVPAQSGSSPRISTRTLLVVGAVIALLLAGIVSFYASSSPDGLEHVAGSLGFESAAKEHHAADSPFADYAVAGVADARLSGGLAGVVGVIAVGLVMAAVIWLVRRSSRSGTTD